jgi:Uma2 family endonuclease
MTTLQEIRRAIESLSFADREKIEDWLRVHEVRGSRIGEAAMDYFATREFVSVERYLELESQSDIRHEYIDGVMYEMFGPSEAHAVISGNLFAAVHAHVRGKPCRAYIENFKVRIERDERNILYYPDLMVSCTREDYYLRYPKLIVEVLSPSTESVDRREKLLTYTQIESLEEYALLAQKTAQFTVHRRSNRWRPQVVSGVEACAHFQSLDLSLPLSQIYEGLSW